MRKTTDLFTINGQPMIAPDSGVSFSYEDLDSSDSGRDESGYMHRDVLRYKVATWGFSYKSLTEAERAYIESLFPDEPTFEFGHPSRTDSGVQEVTTCYRSKYGISWQNAVTGIWSGYSFNIVEC